MKAFSLKQRLQQVAKLGLAGLATTSLSMMALAAWKQLAVTASPVNFR